MAHVRGLVLFLSFLASGGRRNMRVGGSHHDAQQQSDMLANRLAASGGAKETFIPGRFGTGIGRRSEPKQDGPDSFATPRSRFGSRRAKASEGASVRAGVPQMDSKTIPSKNVFVTFADAKDVPPGQITSGFRYGQEIAIVNEKGKLYAVANKVPPTSQPATFGELSGDGTLREPISGTKFSLKTGQVVGEWCPSFIGKGLRLLVGPSRLQTYKVRRSGNSIQVEVNVNAKAQFEASYWRGVLDAQGKVDGGYY